MPSDARNVPLDARSTGLLIVVVSYWGFAFPMIKIVLGEVPPLVIGWFRYLIASLPLLFYYLIVEGPVRTFEPFKRDWHLFLGMGILMVTVANIGQNLGLLYTTASMSALIQTSAPVFSTILAAVFLKESLGGKKLGGTFIAFAASIALVYIGGVTLGGGEVIKGNLLTLVTAISYGMASVVSKTAVSRNDPLKAATFAMFTGSIMLIPVSIAMGEPMDWYAGLSAGTWTVLIMLALFPCLASTTIWYFVLKRTEVSKQILFAYLIPVAAAVAAFAIFGEIIQISSVVLGIIIAIGIYIAQDAKRR